MSSLARNYTQTSGELALSSVSTASLAEVGERVQAAGVLVLRYGLALVIAWIGAMKFTAYEANGIQPLVANSPVMSWVYSLFSVQGFSNLLGTVEIAIAVMIVLHRMAPRLAVVGSAAAVLMFVTTLSFLFSTPGWEPSLGGFPALSVAPGQFVIKDLVLLGAALWLLGESLKTG